MVFIPGPALLCCWSCRTIIGDVHAIAVTSLSTAYQNRFQSSLWKILQTPGRFQYIVGHPRPEWKLHNSQILLHTVLRREAFVKGGVLDFTEVQIASFPSAMKFLSTLNGDWSRSTITYYTAGRATTEEEARLLVYGDRPTLLTLTPFF